MSELDKLFRHYITEGVIGDYRRDEDAERYARLGKVYFAYLKSKRLSDAEFGVVCVERRDALRAIEEAEEAAFDEATDYQVALPDCPCPMPTDRRTDSG